MGALTDLISKVQDAELRDKLMDEAKRLNKQKKFGLVFEDHIPECTPLWGIPVKRGSLVARKSGNIQETFIVRAINGDKALCYNESTKSQTDIPLEELVTVAKFGQPIYPCLKMMDSVCNASDSDLWHTLIEADNYHALQLLEYLYAGKVDCIYIDPPYNTGAKDWKYNNNYVDAADSYRHSKWLSFMEKRLKLAKKLLNPQDSVLICTIDEKEYLHLGCLLEELFPEANIQMVSSVINPAGVSRGGQFARTDEYIFFITFGECMPSPIQLSEDWRGKIKGGYKDKLRWNGLQRSGTATLRSDRPNMFYPVFISENGLSINSIGESIPLDYDRKMVPVPEGSIAIWPIFPDGREGRWRLGRETLIELIKKRYVHIGRVHGNRASITYLAQGEQAKVENGDFQIIGYNPDGSIIVDESTYEARFIPGTQWWITSHDATQKGTKMLNDIIGHRFNFPKSVYAVHDAIRFFVANKPNALIVDFFAGSGTTLHAVNLLNTEDGGHRRCIMVTNNEVSEDEAKSLRDQGYHPGDPEWEQFGIARYVNWPRTTCSILGKNVNGNLLTDEYLTTKKEIIEVSRKVSQISLNGKGLSADAKKSFVSLLNGVIPQNAVAKECHYILSEDYSISILFDSDFANEWLEQLPDNPQIETFYIFTEDKRVFRKIKDSVLEQMPPMTKEQPVKLPMSDGFKANAVFFKLGFLDKNAVALGRQFREMLPTLWMKAGAFGKCPVLPEEQEIPVLLSFPENRFAVLTEETAFAELERTIAEHPEIETVFIITDHEAGFRMMTKRLSVRNAYQLYRDYLDNFRINVVRS